MKTLKTDSFGVLSEKNTMSKYWGVSAAKNGQGFTVRFQDTVSKDTINFKPKSLLSEYVASVIARGFYEDRNLYSSSIEFVVNTQEGDYVVNCCANTIKLVDDTINPSVETYENLKPAVEKALKEHFEIPTVGELLDEFQKVVYKEKIVEPTLVVLKEHEEGGIPLGELKCVIAEENVGKSSFQEETKPVRDISAELREIRRQTALIAKRIDRLAKSLKEVA